MTRKLVALMLALVAYVAALNVTAVAAEVSPGLALPVLAVSVFGVVYGFARFA